MLIHLKALTVVRAVTTGLTSFALSPRYMSRTCTARHVVEYGHAHVAFTANALVMSGIHQR